jgi:hypothetical protein
MDGYRLAVKRGKKILLKWRRSGYNCLNVLLNEAATYWDYSVSDRITNEYEVLVEWYWQGRIKVLLEKSVPLPFCPPRDFSPHQSIQVVYGAHPTSYPMGTKTLS